MHKDKPFNGFPKIQKKKNWDSTVIVTVESHFFGLQKEE